MCSNPYKLENCLHCGGSAYFMLSNDKVKVICSECGCSSIECSFDKVSVADALDKCLENWNKKAV